MPRFLPDTSCMVPIIIAGHQHAAAARREVRRRMDAGEGLVLAAHALAETYSVITRIPPLDRLLPEDAIRLLQASFIDQAQVVHLDAAEYVACLRRAAAEGVSGGRIYDALIAACAVKAGVETVLTFNERHFRPLLPEHVAVVIPWE